VGLDVLQQLLNQLPEPPTWQHHEPQHRSSVNRDRASLGAVEQRSGLARVAPVHRIDGLLAVLLDVPARLPTRRTTPCQSQLPRSLAHHLTTAAAHLDDVLPPLVELHHAQPDLLQLLQIHQRPGLLLPTAPPTTHASAVKARFPHLVAQYKTHGGGGGALRPTIESS
jgi:hypothetical protein